jgi:hypothetical protein
MPMRYIVGFDYTLLHFIVERKTYTNYNSHIDTCFQTDNTGKEYE